MDSSSPKNYDVIVVGAGIMGSTAAYHIAKRGCKVLLLEQFDFLHQRGSSHGETRTIRATYPEHYYPSMAIESSRLWNEAESEIGFKVLHSTPHFDMGPSDNKSLQSVIQCCNHNSISHSILDPHLVLKHFSGRINLPENWIGLCTQLGGVIKATKAVSMFQTLAIQRGAVLKDNKEVVQIKRGCEGDCVVVCTSDGSEFLGRKCVVTVGAWMRKLVERISNIVLPIQPLHTTVCYWKIKEGCEDLFSIEKGFPTFASYAQPYIYGTPSMEFPGLIKIAVHGGEPCDPDKRHGTPYLRLSSWVEERFGGLVESKGPVIVQTCMYSMTPDGDFVIDFLGGEFGRDVVVAGGFSGHGFKMAPVVGRLLGELVLDGEAQGVELSQFRIGRFEDNPLGNVKEYEEQIFTAYDPTDSSTALHNIDEFIETIRRLTLEGTRGSSSSMTHASFLKFL
ncbi:hypothetical protein Sjap_022990 [Stephania japonica]|uniref:FAD dependent oxidoreductase domain-containing protein n=1 Tax=Stephania japonica TaxID=461633 RepID=A0AAP0EX17_9MAGN